MTLGELWEEFGQDYADSVIVLDINGKGSVVACGAGPVDDERGESVLMITNMEGS